MSRSRPERGISGVRAQKERHALTSSPVVDAEHAESQRHLRAEFERGAARVATHRSLHGPVAAGTSVRAEPSVAASDNGSYALALGLGFASAEAASSLRSSPMTATNRS